MPRTTIQPRHSRRVSLTDGQLLELRCGHDFCKEAWSYAHLKDPVAKQAALAEVRDAYLEHREAIDKAHRDNQRQPWTRCWGWWQFVADPPRNRELPEFLDLLRRGEITASEAAAGAQRDIAYWRCKSSPRPWIALLTDAERRQLQI